MKEQIQVWQRNDYGPSKNITKLTKGKNLHVMHLHEHAEYCIKQQDYKLNSSGPKNLKIYE